MSSALHDHGVRSPVAGALASAVVASLLAPACVDRTVPETPPDPAREAAPANPPPALRLFDDGGREVDPFGDASSGVHVFVFVRSDCPISNRYAPEVRALAERYGPRGVAFRVVYADPDETEEGIAAHRDAYAFGAEVLRDATQVFARWAGARVTPEAVVYVRGPGVVYRGRIDDRYRAFGDSRPRAGRHDLEDAVAASLAGDPPSFHVTEAVGCAIRSR